MTRSRQHGKAHVRHHHVRRNVDLPNLPDAPNTAHAQAQASTKTLIHDQPHAESVPVHRLPATRRKSSEKTRQETKKVTAACLACRRRKTRCSGGPPPCSACHQHNSECVIDPASDRRRKVPRAVLHDLDTHGPALSRLIDALRQPGAASDRVLASIRDGATLAQVLARVESSRTRSCHHTIAGTKKTTEMSASESEDEQITITDTSKNASQNVSRWLSPSLPTDPPGKDDYVPSNLSGEFAFLLAESSDHAPDNEVGKTANDINLIGGLGRRAKRDRRGWHPSLQLLRSEYNAYDEAEGVMWEHLNALLPYNDSESSTNSGWGPDAPGSFQHSRQTKQNWHSSPGYVTSFGNLPMSSALRTNGYPGDVQSQQLNNFKMHEYQILPLNLHDNSLLSNLTTSFRAAATKMIADGMPISEVFGPDDPNMDLLLRDRLPTDTFSVSNWAAELCRRFPAYDLPELLRGAYFFAYYMRWIILPTRENYEAIAVEYRPTMIQRLIPHSPVIDLQPTRALRNALCLDYRDFMTPQEIAISVNWPYSREACVQVNPATGLTHLSAAFREHICDESNLTFSSVMVAAFPELKGHVNLKEKVTR